MARVIGVIGNSHVCPSRLEVERAFEYSWIEWRRLMVALRKPPVIVAEVACDPSVMSGELVVRGTRVPAETIVAYLRAGRSNLEIFEDYPTLPIDGIDAVIRWAELNIGSDWKTSLGLEPSLRA